MKIICIGSKLICIVCIHTECALSTIHIERAFTFIGGLKPVWRWIASWREICRYYTFVCDRLCEEMSNKARYYFVALLRLAALSVIPCVMRLCTFCGLVALSVLSSPLDGMCNLSAKLVLLLHHINNWNRNQEAIVQFSCIIMH